MEVESAAMSCCPRVSESKGIDSGIRIASAASPAITGCLAMSLAHLAHRPLLIFSSLG